MVKTSRLILKSSKSDLDHRMEEANHKKDNHLEFSLRSKIQLAENEAKSNPSLHFYTENNKVSNQQKK